MRKNILSTFLISVPLAIFAQNAAHLSPEINGPLKHLDANPNYFTDNTGKAIFLIYSCRMMVFHLTMKKAILLLQHLNALKHIMRLTFQ